MNAHTTTLATALALLALAPASVPAQDKDSSFLSDYSKLQKAKDNPFDEIYASPEALKSAAKYDSVMVDQPELFLHPDSKYKGLKPDDMKALADSLRERVTTELKTSYKVVDKPGANVLYVRLAVGDLLLQKKKRPILAYIPVGARLRREESGQRGDQQDRSQEHEDRRRGARQRDARADRRCDFEPRQPECGGGRSEQAGLVERARQSVRHRRQAAEVPPRQLAHSGGAVGEVRRNRSRGAREVRSALIPSGS